MSLPQAAKICSISRWTLRSCVRSGELNASLTPGGHYRIYRKDLEEFILKKGLPTNTNDKASLKTILVVDDDIKIRKLLSQLLRSKGYEVTTASDGFEAGQMTVKLIPDLVILDIFMPQMDGFEVCRRLREDHATKHIKIIAISGLNTIENRQKILNCGADLFLPKPLDLKKIVEQLDNLLG